MTQVRARMDAATASTSSPASYQVTAEAAERRLSQSPYIELRRISCNMREGVLTLFGSVPSYYLKQMAQNVVHCLPGVWRVENNLEVVSSLALSGAGRGDSHSALPARSRPR